MDTEVTITDMDKENNLYYDMTGVSVQNKAFTLESLAGGAGFGHFLVRFLFILHSARVLTLTAPFSLPFFCSISAFQPDKAQYLAIKTDPVNAQSNKVVNRITIFTSKF